MEPANESPTETQENLEQALAMGPTLFRLRIPMEQHNFMMMFILKDYTHINVGLWSIQYIEKMDASSCLLVV